MEVIDYRLMINQSSVIRKMYKNALDRAEQIGYENVFDYSLGNPSVPVPEEFNNEIIRLLTSEDSKHVHEYSPNAGIVEVREAIAKSLNSRFGIDYKSEHIFMTAGATSAIAHSLRCVTKQDDEVIVFAPFFPEYTPYVKLAGCKLKVVEPDIKTFQINFEKLEQLLTPEVTAIIVNSPNNPTGIAYSEETIIKLAKLLENKQKEFNHDIFIISDEPYREISFDNIKIPYIAKYYKNTLTCYSFSKSLSIPGERIGYIAINPECKDADIMVSMCVQISRGLGQNAPASIIQRAIVPILDKTAQLSVYENNMNILYDELIKLGFKCVKPNGTFYLFPQSLEDDANIFCQKATKYDLFLVPGDSFGCCGHFRIAYCVQTEKVKRSIFKFREFVQNEYCNLLNKEQSLILR